MRETAEAKAKRLPVVFGVGGITATVKGDHGDYGVQVGIVAGRVSYRCTCPVGTMWHAGRPKCSHVRALVLALNPDRRPM